MTPTVQQLLARNKIRPVRRCYIKRRSVGDVFETNWYRIDNYGNRDSVLSYGTNSLEINWQPGQIAAFDVSELQMEFNNQDGNFNVETDVNSIWYGYLNRQYTKLKITTAYLDENDNEVGTADDFEGVIWQVLIGEQDQKARITILSYQAIIQSFPITDLALTGSKTISQLVTAIMNQAKITRFIPYVAPSQTLNPTITDSSNLTGTYWDVLKEIADQANAIPYLDGATFSFQDRTPSATTKWAFTGTGNANPDIYQVINYDDEGATNVRVYWIDSSNTSYTSISSDTTLLAKYLRQPEQVDLTEITNGTDKQNILDAKRNYWQYNRPVIEFQTRYFQQLLTVLDKITINIIGKIVPISGVGIWGGNAWGDGCVWGNVKGPINILSSTTWMITRIQKDRDSWMTTIRAEKIV